jgi:hypothetical protein
VNPAAVLYHARDPRLSVILATDRYATIRNVVARLTAQTVLDEIELVIVAPPGAMVDLDAPSVHGFAAVRLVETDTVLPLAPARAAGVRAATAPIVCVGETHSFPHADWAEVLIRAHAGPWTVVVPAFGNANPENALSWAAFLRDYGRWMDGLPAGETTAVPPYNTATKREALLAFGDRLPQAVSQGEDLVLGLRARGQRAYFEPAARIDHANVSRPGSWISQRYVVGRVLAGARVPQWSWGRRLLYVGGSPLIPVVVLSRLLDSVRLARRSQRLPAGTMPALMVGIVLSAAGEMVSYAVGAAARVVLGSDEYELHKLSYTSGRIRTAPARG